MQRRSRSHFFFTLDKSVISCLCFFICKTIVHHRKQNSDLVSWWVYCFNILFSEQEVGHSPCMELNSTDTSTSSDAWCQTNKHWILHALGFHFITIPHLSAYPRNPWSCNMSLYENCERRTLEACAHILCCPHSCGIQRELLHSSLQDVTTFISCHTILWFPTFKCRLWYHNSFLH